SFAIDNVFVNGVAASHTITASAGAGGTINPSGAVTVSNGGSQSFTIAPGNCHGIADVLVDGASVGAVPSYTFNNVQADHTIHALFAAFSYKITISAGPNGSTSPSGSTMVDCGSSLKVTVTPDPGYVVKDVPVDGVSVGAV